MRLSGADPTRLERLQDEIAKLLDQDWKGRDAEELARRLRRLRVQIAVETAAYQVTMRELQQARRQAS